MSIQKKKIIVESITCDLCGKTVQYAHNGLNGVEWENGDGDTQRTCVQFGEGYSYHDCGNIEFRTYHICPTCFATKLEVWLKSQEVKYTPAETDW